MIVGTLLLLTAMVSQWEPYPYTCTDIVAYETRKGDLIFKSTNDEIPESQTERTREIVKLVASEMGADPRLFLIWAKRESKFRYDIVGVHPSDISANQDAWEDHRWSTEKHSYLSDILEDPTHENYWKAKGEYQKIQKFVDNPYYNHEISVPVFIKNSDEPSKYVKVNAWSFPYGLYSMNSALYGEPDMPPWAHCDDDGVFSTIKAVWASRKFQNQCESLGFVGDYGTIDRRFSRGHCMENASKDFSKRAASHHLNVKTRARLGKKFPKKSTKKDVIIQHMKDRVKEECLTEELYKTNLCKNPNAVGFAH